MPCYCYALVSRNPGANKFFCNVTHALLLDVDAALHFDEARMNGVSQTGWKHSCRYFLAEAALHDYLRSALD